MITKGFAYLVLFWGLLGILLQTVRSLFGENPLQLFLLTHFYFTTQSNILIIIVSTLYLTKQKRGSFFTSLSFITLINIFVTGVVFHTLLVPYMENVTFVNHILHTINPILYIIFYFFIIQEHLAPKKFYLALLYPIIYMLLVYIIIEPFFGNMMEANLESFPSARFVYPFLDPANYERGIPGLLMFNLGILAPIISLVSFGFCYLKSLFEKEVTLI
jgi:hypothetical protein